MLQQENNLAGHESSHRNSDKGVIRGELQPSRQADLVQSTVLRRLLLYTNTAVVRKYSGQIRYVPPTNASGQERGRSA